MNIIERDARGSQVGKQFQRATARAKNTKIPRLELQCRQYPQIAGIIVGHQRDGIGRSKLNAMGWIVGRCDMSHIGQSESLLNVIRRPSGDNRHMPTQCLGDGDNRNNVRPTAEDYERSRRLNAFDEDIHWMPIQLD